MDVGLVFLDGQVSMEGFREELKLDFFRQQRRVNEKTYQTVSMEALPMLRLADLPGVALTL